MFYFAVFFLIARSIYKHITSFRNNYIYLIEN